MIYATTLAHAPSYVPQSTMVSETDTTSLEATADSATLLMLLMLQNQHAQDRMADNGVSATSKLKSEENDRELADRQQTIKAHDSKGFFDSIGQLVTDAFKTVVTGNFDALGDDLKNMAESPQFWSDLQKIASVAAEVASTVASVASFGAGSASLVATTAFVVGAVLSTAGMVEQNFHVLAKLTNDPTFAQYFTLGCMVGSAIAGLGGALINGVAAAQQTAQVAVSETTKDIKLAASTLSAAGHIASAVFQAPQCAIQYGLDEANIDATKQAMQQELLQSLIGDAIAKLNEQHKEVSKDVEVASSTIETEQNTQLTAASMLRA